MPTAELNFRANSPRAIGAWLVTLQARVRPYWQGGLVTRGSSGQVRMSTPTSEVTLRRCHAQELAHRVKRVTSEPN
jgi:hypothetical protein